MEGTWLGKDVDSGNTVFLGQRERGQGLYVLGGTGTGKSTLLLNLILQDIEVGHGLCLLDPHGDLVDGTLARLSGKREEDVILLDPLDSAYPFGLNLFECSDPWDPEMSARTCSQVMQVFEKLWGAESATPSWGPQMEDLLRNATLTLIENPGYTMAEMTLLLESEEFRNKLAEKLQNDQVRQFWQYTYNPLRPTDQSEYRRSSLNKVQQFLSQPIVYHIVGQSRSTLNFRAIMDEGKVLLVRLATGRLGGEVTALLGSVIAGQILNAALSREDVPEERRKPFHLYADEYQRFATPDFATLLSEARKFGVATTIAHQFRGQFKPHDANRGATMNVANKVVFRVSGEDAQELAAEFDTTPPPPPVVGQRPKLTICQTPVVHLVRDGHESKGVRDLVRRHIAPLYVSQADLEEERRQGKEPMLEVGFKLLGQVVSGYGYFSSLRDIMVGLKSIDQWLIAKMERRALSGSKEEVYLLGSILVSLRGCFGIAEQRRISMEDLFDQWKELDLPEGSRSALFGGLFLLVQGENARKVFTEYREERRQYLWRSMGNLSPFRARKSEEERRQASDDWAQWEYEHLIKWSLRLMMLGLELAGSPIMVNSGQYEPIYDRPRAYADVLNEIATGLANLHPYHAKCKMLQGGKVEEHNIRTLPAQEAGEAHDVNERVERIKDNSRRRYARPREEVRQQIRERQQAREEPPPVRRRT